MFKKHAQSLFQINDVKMMNERRLKALKKKDWFKPADFQ